MKKELQSLLTVSSLTKQLRVNGAFNLEAVPVDSIGRSATVFHVVPDHMVIRLVYSLPHDKFTLRSRTLSGKTEKELMAEIPFVMRSMLDEMAESLVSDFKNGYLLGDVEEVI